MLFKRKIKKIVLFLRLCKSFKKALNYIVYDYSRFIKYSNSYFKNDNKNKLLGLIVAEYHVVEKGITMPMRKLGFGLQNVDNLIKHCNQFIDMYGADDEQLLFAISSLIEYQYIHKNENFNLPNVTSECISALSFLVGDKSKIHYESHEQSEYFKNTKENFLIFSNSRKSIRHFSGQVPIENIESAIDLAQNSPSACNRQLSRVTIVRKKDVIDSILSLQSGNRGFGFLSETLLIVSVELGGFLSFEERNDAYVNGGIYLMNLLYSLHYYNVAACTLNWCTNVINDVKVHSICEIPKSEVIVAMIACGDIPLSFCVAKSERLPVNKIKRYIL